jgi:hypothetical protein
MKNRIPRGLSKYFVNRPFVEQGLPPCRGEMERIRSRFGLGLIMALVLCCRAVLAATPAPPTIVAVQAELISDMNARLLKVGATIYARVTADWQGTDCVLRSGAILEAHVMSVSSYRQNAKVSEVDLAFTGAQCRELKMRAFPLLLAAMGAPPQNSDLGILTSPLPFSTSAGHTAAQGWGSIAALGTMQQGAILNLQMDMHLYKSPPTPRMRMGEVDGIKGLKLDVATGPENSSVLTCRGHDVSLEKHTLLLLVPAQATFPPAEIRSDAARPAPADTSGVVGTTPAPDTIAAMPALPPIDDLDLCAPPQCNVALPPGTGNDGVKPGATISISQLGYSPRPQKAMENFDHDEVLAYLSPTELLVTFNPHILAPRHSLGRSGSTARVIRAALVDTETHRVTHTVDWELPDNREYLWPLGEGRVLVHVGSELRVYGEGLNVYDRVPLDGPLAFVRATPDGSFVAVGVIRERHTPELHAQLSQSLNRDPDEDVDVLVLNRSFETIARSKTQSGIMPPTLLNEGQATLESMPDASYRVSLLTWDNHGSILARFKSSCTPELSSFAPDLILVVSCNKQTRERAYRVLNSNGKLSLKSDSHSNNCGNAAKGSANRQTFVVKTVQSSNPVLAGDAFSARDLASEDLEVYRATDGKRLLGVRVASPSSSRDGYALAPDSSQLAVLTRDQISVYSVAKD